VRIRRGEKCQLGRNRRTEGQIRTEQGWWIKGPRGRLWPVAEEEEEREKKRKRKRKRKECEGSS
jgi:hypothetical protein